jgi:hypothetical protein
MVSRRSWSKRLAWANAVAMGLVLLLGATVTATGSGFGCGESWPLCHGRLLPPLTAEGIIEYSHRLATLVSGLVLVALLALTIVERRELFARWETRIVAGLLVGTLLLQSALGAAAVLAPRHPLVMAVHFGVSLTVFASALLLALVLTRGESLRARRQLHVPAGVVRASLGTPDRDVRRGVPRRVRAALPGQSGLPGLAALPGPADPGSGGTDGGRLPAPAERARLDAGPGRPGGATVARPGATARASRPGVEWVGRAGFAARPVGDGCLGGLEPAQPGQRAGACGRGDAPVRYVSGIGVPVAAGAGTDGAGCPRSRCWCFGLTVSGGVEDEGER